MMIPILVGLFLLMFAAGDEKEKKELKDKLTPALQDVPPDLLRRLTRATAAGDASEMRAVAVALEQRGLVTAAADVRDAADQVDKIASIPEVANLPPGARPVPVPVLMPPDGAVPVTPKPVKPPPVAPPGVIDVSKPIDSVDDEAVPVVARPPAGAKPISTPGVWAPPSDALQGKAPFPAIPVVAKPPAGAKPVPVPVVAKPPPAAKPVPMKKPPPVAPKPIPVVAAPPPGAKPAPAPKPVPAPPPGARPVEPDPRVPDPTSLAGKTALMLYQSEPRKTVKDPALLGLYKTSTGVRGANTLYGKGTAQSLMVRGIVPPTPWDWPASGAAAAKKSYKNELLYKARTDKAREEEWLQAAAAVK